MTQIRRVKLDVLKPHQPNVLELANAIAACGPNYQVSVTVDEMDEKTESVIVTIQADNIDFEAVTDTIVQTGGSLHSIDEVQVCSTDDQA
jgi:hypothetical protein